MIMSRLRGVDGSLDREAVLAEIVKRAGVKRSRVMLAEQSLIDDGLIQEINHKLSLGSD